MIACLGKWALIIYLTQASIGIGVGVYLGITTDPATIERMVSCVAY